MERSVIVVVTNHDQLGNTGHKTGWYLPEVAHPYHVFKKDNFKIDFVSPLGGNAPVDPGSVEKFGDDEICKEFLADDGVKSALENTKKPSDIDPSAYSAIFYAGGHGPMWDIPDNEEIANIAAQIYERGGVVAAVCHGPCGLVNIRLTSGEYLVAGKAVTSFTNSEERAVQLTEVVPFLVEDKLKERGATFSCAEDWAPHVEVSDRVVTGQNPASATPTAEAVVSLFA